MPNNWLAVDSNLPDLSRVKDPKEQISQLFDYMVTLTEQLRYSLQNLSASNWNTAALEELKLTTTDGVSKAVAALEQTVARMSVTVGGYSGRINKLENEMSVLQAAKDAVEESIRQLQEDTGDAQTRLAALEELVSGDGGIEEQIDAIQEEVHYLREDADALSALIQETDAGLQIGGEGKDVHLAGNIYINGVLLELGGAIE